MNKPVKKKMFQEMEKTDFRKIIKFNYILPKESLQEPFDMNGDTSDRGWNLSYYQNRINFIIDHQLQPGLL